MKPQKSLLAVVAASFCVAANSSHGAMVAFDSAADTVYNDGWQSGDNGGSGWGGGWTLGGVNGFSGNFIGNSAANGNGDGNSDGDINTSGRAWGQFSHTFNTASAVRPFSGGLSVTQTFGIAFDNGFIKDNNPVGTVGFGLQNSSGNNVFEFYFEGGDANFTVNSGSYSGTTPGFSDEGLTLAFTLTGTNTFSIQIGTLNPAVSFSGTGTLLNPAGGQVIDRVRLFSFNAAPGTNQPAFDSFANSISVVPEPATALLGSLGILGLLRRRK